MDIFGKPDFTPFVSVILFHLSQQLSINRNLKNIFQNNKRLNPMETFYSKNQIILCYEDENNLEVAS